MTVKSIYSSDTPWESPHEGESPSKVENWRLQRHIERERLELSQNAMSIARTIAGFRDQASGKCCPGKDLIITYARTSKSGFQRGVNELAEHGVMYRMPGTGVPGRTSRYWFAFDRDVLCAVMEANGIDPDLDW